MDLHEQLPVLIIGDLNADLCKLEVVQDALGYNHLHDIEAIASAFGGIDNDYTCRLNATATCTRRDFVLANF